MSYKEKNVVAKFTKDNYFSDCGDYHVKDLLDMFDETNVTKNDNELFDYTVNDCIEHDLVTKDLVVVEEYDNGMYVYLREEQDIPCSLELDYEFQQQSE